MAAFYSCFIQLHNDETGYDQYDKQFHLCALKFILVHLMLNSWENKVANSIQPLFTYHDL